MKRVIELTDLQEAKLNSMLKMAVQYNTLAIVPMSYKLINKNVESSCSKLIVCTADYQIIPIDFGGIDTFIGQCQIIGTPDNLPVVAEKQKELMSVKRNDLDLMRNSMMKSLSDIENADGIDNIAIASRKAKSKSDTVNTIIKVAMTELSIRKSL